MEAFGVLLGTLSTCDHFAEATRGLILVVVLRSAVTISTTVAARLCSTQYSVQGCSGAIFHVPTCPVSAATLLCPSRFHPRRTSVFGFPATFASSCSSPASPAHYWPFVCHRVQGCPQSKTRPPVYPSTRGAGMHARQSMCRCRIP